MKIKSAFFTFIQLIVLSFISYGVVKILTISQIKKEHASLGFIPNDASFVGRIDSKEIGKEILHEFIVADGLNKLPKKRKEQEFNMSFIDFDYPLYFFTKNINDNQIAIAAIQLTDQELFLKTTNKSNENSFGFCHNGIGFWVINGPKKDSEIIKSAIVQSKSSKWDKLRSSSHNIAFMAKPFNLNGHVDITKNLLKIDAQLNSLLIPSSAYKKLKTDGLNLTVSNPLSMLKSIGSVFLPQVGSSFQGIKALSINHTGFRSPFFPNLTALIQVDPVFNLENALNALNSSQIEYVDNKLYLAGSKYYVSKPQDDCYLVSHKENKTFAIENSTHFIESTGDLTKLVDFSDAPLMKLFLLSNSTFSSVYSIIQKTEKFNFRMAQSESSNSQTIDLSLQLKKGSTFYGEMLTIFL